jgi:energy-coupling factor transport system permease protein
VTARRLVHPGAWWIWAVALAACALRTTNPLLLCLIIAVAGWVVVSRRSDAPWSRSFASCLRLGAIVIVIRVVFQILFGSRLPGTTLFTVPEVTLPPWMAGVSLGGPVTAESLVAAFYQGLRLATVLACFGAATALCSPYRMLRALPSALYEAGVAVTVAFTFAPQAVVAAGQVREARRLRGRADRGLRAWTGSAMPVLEGALDRAVALAASMDGRGYGRHGDAPVATRRWGIVLTLLGLVCIAVGSYGLLDLAAPAVFRIPALVLGGAALCGSLVAGSRGHHRSRYRPDPWVLPEWLISLSGLVALAAFVVTGRNGAALDPSVYPLEVPELPIIAVLGVLIAAVPAWVAPLPPTSASTSVPLVVAA